VRFVIFVVGAIGLGVVLVVAVVGLPDFGRDAGAYARLTDAIAPAERHVTSVVGAITFDIRAVDSLGEEAILFAAVAAVAMALHDIRSKESDEEAARKDDRAHDEGSGRDDTSEIIVMLSMVALPIIVLVGLSEIGHGHLTPGGGFQGGVVVAAGLTLFYVGADRNTFDAALPETAMEPMDGTGLGGYLALGIVGLIAGTALFENTYPLGALGRLVGGGMMPLLSVAVGLEVTAGLVIVVKHFLDQLVRLADRRRLS
jgi:multicomponent Na+:H+ antiporter subunit B